MSEPRKARAVAPVMSWNAYENPLLASASAGICAEQAVDSDSPPPGESFFHLVQYHDGASNSYGAERANKLRVPAGGDRE